MAVRLEARVVSENGKADTRRPLRLMCVVYYKGPPPIPIRPASPLPPGVPTGPRNQNRYKDRDGNAPAVEGLDYGGGMQNSGDMDERTVRYF